MSTAFFAADHGDGRNRAQFGPELDPNPDPYLRILTGRAVYERVRMQLMGTTPDTHLNALPQLLDDHTDPSETKSVIASLSNWKWSA